VPNVTKIFLAVAEISLPVPTYPRIRYTKLFNHVVHRRLWTKVHEICYTYKAPVGLFTVKIWTRVAAENCRRIAKIDKFYCIANLGVFWNQPTDLCNYLDYFFLKLSSI